MLFGQKNYRKEVREELQRFLLSLTSDLKLSRRTYENKLDQVQSAFETLRQQNEEILKELLRERGRNVQAVAE